MLVYSTYLGSGGADQGTSIAVDSTGNAYVTGFTNSINFPTSSAAQASPGGQEDAFIVKLNPSGNQLVYATYLGGDGSDTAGAIAVDAAGNAYVIGVTGSTNFPVMNALQQSNRAPFNAFVTKLGPTGNLVYSTYLGGDVGDFGSSIAVDSAGNIYVAGGATSTNFPTASPIQAASAGLADVHVAKLNPSGSQLVYSTYLGGAGDDVATGITVDSSCTSVRRGGSPVMLPVTMTQSARMYSTASAVIPRVTSAVIAWAECFFFTSAHICTRSAPIIRR